MRLALGLTGLVWPPVGLPRRFRASALLALFRARASSHRPDPIEESLVLPRSASTCFLLAPGCSDSGPKSAGDPLRRKRRICHSMHLQGANGLVIRASSCQAQIVLTATEQRQQLDGQTQPTAQPLRRWGLVMQCSLQFLCRTKRPFFIARVALCEAARLARLSVRTRKGSLSHVVAMLVRPCGACGERVDALLRFV